MSEKEKRELFRAKNEAEDNMARLQRSARELDQLAAEHSACESIKAKLDEVQRELFQLQSSKRCVEDDLQCAAEKDGSLEEQLHHKDLELQNLCEELRNRTREITNMQKMLDNCCNDNKGYQTEIQDFERELCELKNDKEKLKSDLTEACNMYNTLAKRAECLESELTNCKTVCDQFERDMRELQTRLEEACNERAFLQQRLSKLELDLKQACSEVKILNEQLNDSRMRENMMSEKLLTAEDDKAKYEACIQKFQSKLKDCEDYAYCLQQQLDQNQQRSAMDDQKCVAEIRRLRMELEEEQRLRRRIESETANKDHLIRCLRQGGGSQVGSAGY